MQLRPKPTEFRGIRYRSRTEARWAVFLGHCEDYSTVVYEPRGWSDDHAPDFVAARCYEDSIWLDVWEIKPKRPTNHYMADLESWFKCLKVQSVDPLNLGLILGIGSFFPDETCFSVLTFCPYLEEWSEVGRQPVFTKAAEAARHWRFDLPDHSPGVAVF